MPDFYSPPSDLSSRRKLRATMVSSIAIGMLVRITKWPTSATDTGDAIVCPDTDEPHAFVEQPLSDVDSTGFACPAARDWCRARAGAAFAADKPLKLSGGRLVEATTGNTAYFTSIKAAAAADDLVLVRWTGKTIV